MIDLAPTFVEWFGGKPKPHWLKWRSLVVLASRPQTVFGETWPLVNMIMPLTPPKKLKVPVPEARMYMVTDGRWKYIHADGVPPNAL